MKIRGDVSSVNLSTGERKEFLVGDGEVRQVPAALHKEGAVQQVRDKLWEAAKLSPDNGWLGNLGDTLNAALAATDAPKETGKP